ncbi:MAG: hypothetical protein OXG05_13855 [Gammaproteobacteria bacterium]|nr:hypothetical protein [Gammaproteobacteria bacterium]
MSGPDPDPTPPSNNKGEKGKHPLANPPGTYDPLAEFKGDPEFVAKLAKLLTTLITPAPYDGF